MCEDCKYYKPIDKKWGRCPIREKKWYESQTKGEWYGCSFEVSIKD